jgi:hypothetical protein
MKSLLILGLFVFQVAALAQTAPVAPQSSDEIVALLASSAEQHKLTWIDNSVISANTKIMAEWIIYGEELTVSCVTQKDSKEVCKVSSKVPLHDQTGEIIGLRQKTVKFTVENGEIVGDIMMLE